MPRRKKKNLKCFNTFYQSKVKRSKVTKTRRFIFCSCYLPSLVGSIWMAVIWNVALHQGWERKSMAEHAGSSIPSKRALPPIFYCQSTSHNHIKRLRGSNSTCAQGKRARNSWWIAQMTIVPFIEQLPFIECLLCSLTAEYYLTSFYLILMAILEGVTIIFTLKMRTPRFGEISKCPRSQLVAGLGCGVCGTPKPASLHFSTFHLCHSLPSLSILVYLVKHHSPPFVLFLLLRRLTPRWVGCVLRLHLECRTLAPPSF